MRATDPRTTKLITMSYWRPGRACRILGPAEYEAALYSNPADRQTAHREIGSPRNSGSIYARADVGGRRHAARGRPALNPSPASHASTPAPPFPAARSGPGPAP